MFSGISRNIFFGGHFWKYKPPGGLPGTNPGFSETQIPVFIFLGNIYEKKMLVRYRRINNKGVLERPGTKWKVLRTISSTLKFEYFRKVDFLMPCKTKSRENLCLRLRMVRAVTLDTPRPPKYQPEFWKNKFLWKSRFFSFPTVFAFFWALHMSVGR